MVHCASAGGPGDRAGASLLLVDVPGPALSFNSLAAVALVVLAINPSDLSSTGPTLVSGCGNHNVVLAILAGSDRHERSFAETSLSKSELVHAKPAAVFPFPAVSVLYRRLDLDHNAAVGGGPFSHVLARRLGVESSAMDSDHAGIAGRLCVSVCGGNCAAGGRHRRFLLQPAALVFGKGDRSCVGSAGQSLLGLGARRLVAVGVLWRSGRAGGCSQDPPGLRWCFGLLAAWTALGLAVSYIPRSSRLRCTFLSVGHGSAAVLELPSGKTLLYDAGEFGVPRGQPGLSPNICGRAALRASTRLSSRIPTSIITTPCRRSSRNAGWAGLRVARNVREKVFGLKGSESGD